MVPQPLPAMEVEDEFGEPRAGGRRRWPRSSFCVFPSRIVFAVMKQIQRGGRRGKVLSGVAGGMLQAVGLCVLCD